MPSFLPDGIVASSLKQCPSCSVRWINLVSPTLPERTVGKVPEQVHLSHVVEAVALVDRNLHAHVQRHVPALGEAESHLRDDRNLGEVDGAGAWSRSPFC